MKRKQGFFGSMVLMGVFTAMLFVLMGFLPQNISAAPAYDGIQHGTQPNGTAFQYRMIGDENFHYFVDTQGSLIQQDEKSGYWCFVQEKGGTLVLGGKVGVTIKENTAQSAVLKSNAGKKAYCALAGESYQGKRITTNTEIVTVEDIPRTASSQNGEGTEGGEVKEIPLLSIVIGFNNTTNPEAEYAVTPYSADYDWNEALFSGDYSAESFYRQESLGKVAVVPVAETSVYNTDGNTNKADKANDGIIHITLNRSHGNWKGDFDNLDTDKDMMSAFIDAVTEAGKYIDFSSYDVNKNGSLEMQELAIQFIVAGYEASFDGGKYAPSVWAHQWDLDGLKSEPGMEDKYKEVLVDGVSLSPYIVMGEMYSNTMTAEKDDPPVNTQAGIDGTIHEFGHLLGLPDLYDTSSNYNEEWSDYDVSGLSSMAAGSWGVSKNGEQMATFLDPYCRTLLGFIEPEVITESGNYKVTSRAAAEGYHCYKILTGEEDQYFLLENREYSSFDQGLWRYYGEKVSLYDEKIGLVLWHIDQGIVDARDILKDSSTSVALMNTVNTPDHRPGIMPCFDEELTAFYQYPIYNNTLRTSLQLKWDTRLYQGDVRKNRIDSGISVATTDEGASAMNAYVQLKTADLAITPVKKTYGDADFSFTATGGEGTGAVTFSVPNNEVLAITNNIAKIKGAGRVEVTATKAADANFSEQKATYTITVSPKTLTKAMITGIEKEYIFIKDTIRPVPTIKDGVLLTDKDYTLTYGANVKVGRNGGSVTVEGKNNYTGKITTNFDIVMEVPNFTDVEKSAWYYDAVNNAVKRGWFIGTSPTTFSPEEKTTRGMLVTILYRIEGQPDFIKAIDFKDVAADVWYTKAAGWAAETGIVSGYGNGYFGAEDPVTREQMVTIFYRYAQWKNYNTSKKGDLSAFVDRDKISPFAQDAMTWAVGLGLIKGVGNGYLLPQDGATRAQMATVLTTAATLLNPADS